MTDKERERDKQLIANLEAETSEQADEIERLQNELRALKRDLTWTRDRLLNVERGRYDKAF